MAHSEDELVELIARQVRARLMAGGTGPGYTRAPVPPTDGDWSPEDLPPGELRKLACHDDPDGCSACGLCVVRRPWDVKGLMAEGAVRIASAPGTGKVDEEIGRYIDHTLLKPEATREQLLALCEEARLHRFASVCVNSSMVHLAKTFLRGSGVPVCAVVGFPLGAMTPRAKAFETREAIRCGAGEIDMVINIGALKSGDLDLVESDIRGVVEAARPVPVKVILETSKLDDEEKIVACALAKAAGAAFVKTSTGFGGGGATADDVALMRRIVGRSMGVKASGGIRSAADAHKMLDAGANRLGASASVAIVTGKTSKSSY